MVTLAKQAACTVLLLVTGTVVHGQKPPDWTEGELALVAPYCIDTMGWKYGDSTNNTSPRAGYWVSRMGPSFWHMHHYCVAILNLRRVTRYPVPERNFRYGVVIGDLEYVVRNSPADFVMLPEVFSRIGEVELLRNNPGAAYAAFERARRQRPDFPPAYTHWAQYLTKLGKRSEALALVSEGLRHAPNSGVLRDLYRQYGGNMAAMPAAAASVNPPATPSAAASAAEPASAASSP